MPECTTGTSPANVLNIKLERRARKHSKRRSRRSVKYRKELGKKKCPEDLTVLDHLIFAHILH